MFFIKKKKKTKTKIFFPYFPCSYYFLEQKTVFKLNRPINVFSPFRVRGLEDYQQLLVFFFFAFLQFENDL